MINKIKNIEKISRHKLILLGNEHYNPLGLVRSIGELGLPVIAIIIRGDSRLVSKSKYITHLHFVDDLNEGFGLLLKEYGDEEYRPFIFTCDDTATDFLNMNYELLKDRFYFFNSGGSGSVNRYMSKYQQVELAKSIGMNVLWTKEIQNKQIPDDMIFPVITKAIDSRERGWKQLSYICNDEEELKEAFRQIRAEKIILQQFIYKKNELGIDGYAIDHGEQVLFTMAYNYKYIRDGTFSHYMNIFTPNDKQIMDLTSEFLRKLKYEGIFDIEYLEDQDGKYYFCEINLRNSGWSYASTTTGMPLPVLWASAMLEGRVRYDCQLQIPDGYTAMEGFDYLRERRREHKGLVVFVKEFLKTDCHFIFDLKDMGPFWSYVGAILSRKYKKICRIHK